MSDSPQPGFGAFVPGFDFLQKLASAATQGGPASSPQMPNMGSWVAPTLNVEELDKRITELKAVQFWLEQNSRALAATIQALEVQKMTLSTLSGMNVKFGEMAHAFAPKVAVKSAGATQAKAEADADSTGATKTVPRKSSQGARSEAKPAGKGGATQGLVDPVQLWGALTQQFQQIASTAMKDAAQQTAAAGVAAAPVASSGTRKPQAATKKTAARRR
jgi:hypothetical protein